MTLIFIMIIHVKCAERSCCTIRYQSRRDGNLSESTKLTAMNALKLSKSNRIGLNFRKTAKLGLTEDECGRDSI